MVISENTFSEDEIITKYGTKITTEEMLYRQKLIEEQQVCFVTGEFCGPFDGEVLFVNGNDLYISNAGLEKLINIFGEKFIKERIITYD